jgi:hypothetical protein
MNPHHEPSVEHAGTPPPGLALQREPESPPPVGEQAVTFQSALDAFKSRDARFALDVGAIEASIERDMRAEFRREDALRVWP